MGASHESIESAGAGARPLRVRSSGRDEHQPGRRYRCWMTAAVARTAAPSPGRTTPGRTTASCCGATGRGGRRVRLVTLQRQRTGRAAGGGGAGQPGLRQPARGGRAAARARRCWTWAPAAASTCCCPPGGSAPTGFAYGLDMTDEMLDLARANAAKAGATNVEFVKGTHRGHPAARRLGRRGHLQLRDQPVRRQARGAAPRCSGCSRPGGRIGISDVVAEDHLTAGRPAPSAAPTSAASPARCPAREYLRRARRGRVRRRRR